MKKCLLDIIKDIKSLEEELEGARYKEQISCKTEYRNKEEKIIYDYNFLETRKKIEELNDKILVLKSKLNQKNLETKIGINDYTISDGLVKIAMITKELAHLSNMGNEQKFSSRSVRLSGEFVFVELLYNPEECKTYIDEQKELLRQLQVALDRANLNTYIEI